MIGQSAEVGKLETILAYIIASGELGKIIVKWQNSDTGKILSIKNFTHNPNINEEYAWFKSGKGWQTGHYQVSVFTMDDQVTPIGGNSYSIALVTGTENKNRGANDSIIQDLISSGQAIPKRNPAACSQNIGDCVNSVQ